MTQDTEAGNRSLSGEAEGRLPPDQASVEVYQEQPNAVRVDQRDGRRAVHLTRRGLLGRLAGAVGGLVLGDVGHAHAAVLNTPSYPVPEVQMPNRDGFVPGLARM
jgi:hypothetical protein